MKTKNEHAVALGRLGGQKPKIYTLAEKKRRRERLAVARAKRWPKKVEKAGSPE